jgi:hypothetical protein
MFANCCVSVNERAYVHVLLKAIYSAYLSICRKVVLPQGPDDLFFLVKQKVNYLAH